MLLDGRSWMSDDLGSWKTGSHDSEQAIEQSQTEKPLVTGPVLRLSGIAKNFGDHAALSGVDLHLAEGEILGLLGPNGAGKSTIVRTVMGRVRPDSGNVTLFGKELIAGNNADRTPLGCVPQEIALYALLSAKENLSVFGRYHGLSGGALSSATTKALTWAALTDRADEPIKAFSGGMKRRLNMAAGVLHSPRVLLLDEPTVGVDPQSRERMYDMIDTLRVDGVSLLYTTHYMEEAERLCDRIAVIDKGRVIAIGTKRELVEKTFGRGREVIVECEHPVSEEVTSTLRSSGYVVDGTHISLVCENAPEAMQALLRILDRDRVAIREMRVQTPTLENVFLHLTGRELRE